MAEVRVQSGKTHKISVNFGTEIFIRSEKFPTFPIIIICFVLVNDIFKDYT